MAKFDTIYEILEYAISRETDANKFYRNLAEQQEDPAVRKIFNRLANEELGHMAKLELELMKKGKVVVEAEKLAEFEDIIDILAFETDAKTEYKEALLIGIQREKASFRFYVNLAGLTKDKECHEMLLELAEEEARHRVLLALEYDNVVETTDEEST